MGDASRDANYVPTLLGVSSADGDTPVTLYVDPTTHRLLVNTTGSTFADSETPTGAVDGSNTVYTLANTPSPAASLIFVVNGLVQIMGGKDGVLSTATVTLGFAPSSGSVVRAWYRY